MLKKDTGEGQDGNFHLNKWFLDFTGQNGEAMIFYASKLKWHGLSASYTSWLQYNEEHGMQTKSRFFNVHMPQKNGDRITWRDPKFGVSGSWQSLANKIQARLIDSDEGFLDWKCFQPASQVRLKINDRDIKGSGYAEQLILTIPPWKIPMDELRWGRFGSLENIIVWIELREKEKRQWLWLNGDKIENCTIEDEFILIPSKNQVLNLDRGVVLEAEKKIFSVVEKVLRYIPGFNKVMPVHFLMADETKWLSNGRLSSNNKILSNGKAIHELVNFKAHKP